MTTNNKLYKEIAEKVTGNTYPKYYSPLYYMREISEELRQQTYSNMCCSNKYLKDIAEYYTGDEYEMEINRHYLRDIARHLSNNPTLNNLSENGYLTIINEHIDDDRISTTMTFNVSDNNVNPLDVIDLTGSMTAEDNPLVGVDVNLYDGDTLIDTVTTGNDGSFSYNDYEVSTSGTHRIKAEYTGSETYRASSVTVNVASTMISTQISIDSYSSTIEYGDNFNITSTLTDGTNPITGATLYLWLGNTAIGSGVTDSNGSVTFTYSSASVGTHQYTVKYVGNARYTNSNSSSVGITVSKESSVLNISSPITGSYNTGSSISISGSLVDNDSTPNPIANASIVFSKGDGTTATLTTDSDGEFTGTVTYDTIGTYNLSFTYDGDSNYVGSSVSNIVLTLVSESITLTTDGNNILSYADNDSTTLTARLTGATVTGQTVQVLDDSDDSVIGTMTDNNDGTYSYTYNSQGIGDIVLKAKWGSLSSSKYSVEDCPRYVASDSITTVTGGVLTNKYYSVSASTDYVITAKVKSTLGKGFALTFSQYTNSHDYTARTGVTNSGYKYAGVNSGSDDNTITQNTYTANTDISFKIEKIGTTVNLYIDGTLIKTKSNVSWLSNATYVRVDGWNPDTVQTITFTDLKVKPL